MLLSACKYISTDHYESIARDELQGCSYEINTCQGMPRGMPRRIFDDGSDV